MNVFKDLEEHVWIELFFKRTLLNYLMEAGSSEPSLNDEFDDGFNQHSIQKEADNSKQKEIKELMERIDNLRKTVNELVLTLQDDFDQFKELPKQRIENYPKRNGENDEEEEEEENLNEIIEKEKNLILEALHIFLVNAENIQTINKDIESALQEVKDFLKKNPTPEMLKKELDFDSDTASETFRDESKPGTRNSSIIRSQLREAEESKIAAQHKIDQLKEEINQLQYSMSSSPPQPSESENDDDEMFEQHLQEYYDNEMDRFKRILDFRENEIEEMRNVEKECIDTQNDLETENRKFKQDLQTATDQIIEMKRKLVKISTEIESFRVAKSQLSRRNKTLNEVVSELEKAQTETNQRRMAYEKAYEDHQSVVIAYKKAEEIMVQNRTKQDEIISQMIDAVQVSEKRKSDIQKYRSQCDSYRTELKHIEEVITQTKQKVNERVSEMEKASKNYYTPIQEELIKRIEEAKLDNQNLVREKEFLETQIKREQEKLQTLKKNAGFLDNNEFAETLFNLNSQVDSIYQQMNQYRMSAIETKRKIANMNNIDNQMYFQKLQAMKKNAQQIQIDINTSVVALKRIKEQNSHNAEVNQYLSQYIQTKKQELRKYEQKIVTQKDQEIQKLREQLDQMTFSNQKEYMSIEKETKNINDITRSLKEKKDDSSVSCQTKIDLLDSEIQSLNKVQKKLQRQVNSLCNAKSEMDDKTTNIVHKIIGAQTTITKLQAKERRNKDAMFSMGQQNIEKESELAIFRNQISKLDKAIERQKNQNDELKPPQ